MRNVLKFMLFLIVFGVFFSNVKAAENVINFTGTNKEFKLRDSSTGVLELDESAQTFSTHYKFSNISSIATDVGLLRAILGHIDVESLPEGIELTSAYISEGVNPDYSEAEEDFDTKIILNPENGKWAIDFDLSQAGLEFQNKTDLTFTFNYKIIDIAKVPKEFKISLIIDEYVTTSSPDNPNEVTSAINATYQLKKTLTPILGDWNQDGNVSIGDLLYARQYITGIKDLKLPPVEIYDFNGDKNVGPGDILGLRRFLVNQQ
ncbi:MAG: hypothetical protein IJA94_04580 [Bacilli bacterium]|nr:hypothetical protein [Bacilli bacterium]